ncbi:MAG: CoB--CoM heterodisulfide reductase iron-sulfur subunit B family protein [Clostridiales Family XIII bacterium]|jgi:heterodisulfide reductase subunit B|nr:CoB--CoM heterodisulfide reductase iron-sulfur subunit B family protein [Clostridiales Family XIII bacterium]
MLRYAYFPGCASESTAKSTTLANEFVFGAVGIDLVEIEDWCCCGATSAHTLSETVGLALPARALSRAERDHPDLDVVTGCASCYARLKLANYKVRTDKDAAWLVEKALGRPYTAKNEVLNFLDILSLDEVKASIETAILRKFKDLKVACYYGCLNIRPAEVTGAKDRENPMAMDEIAVLTGAVPVDWGFKTECCGAAHQNDAARQTRPLTARILENAMAAGADVILTACPMCQLNLEMRQTEYARKREEKKTGKKVFPLLDMVIKPEPQETIPVLSLTELLAIAMGAGGRRLSLDVHHVPVGGVIAQGLSGMNEKEVREAFI